jgi:hypothetical protein
MIIHFRPKLSEGETPCVAVKTDVCVGEPI